MITRQWLLTTCKRYNKQEYRRFRSKHAEDKFLRNIGLGMDQIPMWFEQLQEQMKWDDEKALFEALHFLRWRLKKALPPNIINRGTSCHYMRRPPGKAQLRIARTFKAIRNRIIAQNLGLVGKCIERSTIRMDVYEMKSSGYMTLLNAAECFDPWRGWRFSTYACSSILRGFSKLLPKKRSIIIISGADPGDQLILDDHDPNQDYLLERLRIILKEHTHNLTDTEVSIVRQRYGIPLNGFSTTTAMTLEDVANKHGVCKERIRQIQLVAIKKLQLALDNKTNHQ